MQTTILVMDDPYGHTGPANLRKQYNRLGLLLAALENYELGEDVDPENIMGMPGDWHGDFYMSCYDDYDNPDMW